MQFNDWIIYFDTTLQDIKDLESVFAALILDLGFSMPFNKIFELIGVSAS